LVKFQLPDPATVLGAGWLHFPIISLLDGLTVH
jgi:hypothetical protein